MNEVQSFLQNFATNHEGYKEVNDFLNSKFEILINNQEWVIRLIKITDPKLASLSQVWLLNSLFVNKKNLARHIEFQQLFELCIRFFSNFEPAQITSQMNRFFQFVAQFSDYLITEQKAIYGIKILMQVIKRVRENEEQVCGTLHREFAKLCIKAKCYQHSLPIIEHAVTNFKKGTSPMDIVSYVYYKGLIYTGLKKYDQAIECFKIVISFPASCTHKVHLESYKKLILLTLIQDGKMPTMPKYTHHMIKYKLENSFQTYRHLGNFYIMKEDKSFTDLINNSYEEFERDKNIGLVKKLQKTFSQVRICELSDTYLTLQFNEMMNSVKTLENKNQIEETLFHMINDGQTKAKIDSKQEMISFIDTTSNTGQDDGKEGEYLEVIEELESQNQRIIALMAQVQEADKGLKMSTQYIKRNLLGKGGADKDNSGGDIFQ